MPPTTLPHADWQDRAGLAPLLDALGAPGGLTRYVGGAVRDTLAGRAVVDVDCATVLLPDEVSARVTAAGFRAVPTGIAHGTVTAILPGGIPIEITTLRRDVSTDGRRASVAFTDDWREDAARRDFTINALSADPVTRAVYDYFGGLADLAAGRVAFIGDPLRRIAEDHLRILRFFRFHARFGGGAPDADALAACTVRANDLMALSRERIADELLKLLGGADPAPTVALMHARGILRPVLPEIDEAGVARLDRLVAREGALGAAPSALRRLGALLPRDPAVARAVAERLKLSKAAQKRLTDAAAPEAAHGDRLPQLAYRIGAEAAADWALIAGEAGTLAPITGWDRPRLAIGGGDLIALGLTRGPVVAQALQAIERAWVEAGFPDADWQHTRAVEAVAQLLRVRQ
ncbi:CCA tRNA nucleotidyltransferase [Sphingomonas solaris]|uniref:CCA tRNA nucleotidyltransferase n=1 Tax=Alterirhizorhabdus solaris TaxID=2529389 RepID=A0A558R1Z1_9SPHN|nr:CCA tRNA nucleotidyltransferase [Sphingomonas solaris]TVV73387.1 CCA tRNA nucleotidyltransferase [Sphingomonas solaris]